MPSFNRYSLTIVAALAACNQDLPDPMGDSDSSSGGPAPTTEEPTPTTGDDALLCTPGQQRCGDAETREVCAPTGLAWQPEPCAAHQTCTQSGAETVASCVGPCEVAGDVPTSVGCDFLAIRVRSSNGGLDPSESYDALIVGNPDPQTASVQLYFVPDNSHQEAAVGAPVLLGPGQAHVFQLTSSAISGFSALRNGGIYRVRSDLPVVAYLHSPLKNTGSNDSSLLLPVKTLRAEHIVASYPAYVDLDHPDSYGGRPSYFNIVALEDDTHVRWIPRQDSFGNGLNVPEVLAGTEGAPVHLLGLDVLQVGAKSPVDLDFAAQDISGTIIESDRPIWVLGGASCARVPFDAASDCNHLQEQMIPPEYWGSNYVAPHPPLRGGEKHYWRVYAGADGVSVVSNPFQVGVKATNMKKGEFADFVVENGASFTFQGVGPFMPVQYLASNSEAGGIGDPAMVQAIPIEQYLERYVFVTGIGYAHNYAQVIRVKDAADVFLNGEKVTGYYLVNAQNALQYEVADVPLGPGEQPRVFFAESDDAFAVNVLGYTGVGEPGSAYAYPGGLALRSLNVE